MTKEELKKILKQFEYETSCKRMKITQFHDTYIVCRFEEIVCKRNPRDPADIEEDVEVIKEKIDLIDIAKSIDEMPSWYWHTIAEDIRLWSCVKYSERQLRKVQGEIKEVNAEIDKGDLTEDEIRQQCNALNQLFGLESNLKWEINVLLNK